MSLLVDREGPRKRVTLNRPDQRNALSPDLVAQLHEVILDSADDGTRLLELSGEGRNFCAGFDLSDLDSQSEGDLLLRIVRIEQLLQAVYHAPFHTLALAHGRVVGAGADMVLACRTRIAAPGTLFEMPGPHFGLILGTRRLSATVGNDRALALLARPFDAETALRTGFVTHLASAAERTPIADAAFAAATARTLETERVLLANLRADTRAQDLADLVASAARPGLKQRIAAYISARSTGGLR
jgi:enoyl-CoA hydratase/carnithine racemase